MIKCYYGKLGYGKSYAMTKHIVDKLNKGYIVYVNYRIDWNGRKFKKFDFRKFKFVDVEYPASNLRAFRTTDDFLQMGYNREQWKELQKQGNAKPVIVALDEGYLYFDSYEATKFKKGVRKKILHSRKQHLDIWYTSQRVMAIHPTLRTMTNIFYKCDKIPLGIFNLFRCREYDLKDESSVDESKCLWSAIYIGRKKYYNIYDTDEIIDDGTDM